MTKPRREPVPPRDLSAQERGWVREILESNHRWADVDINETHVVAQCGCGTCKTVYLDSVLPQNPSLVGTLGYVGRIEIMTTDAFLITITLDQRDGKLGELYVDPLDLNEPGTRTLPATWQEKSRTVIPM